MEKTGRIETQGKTESRREFLKQSLRTVAFSGLIFFTAFLGKRNHFKRFGSNCLENSACRGCLKISNCEDPQAFAFKQKHQRGGKKVVRK